MKTLLTIIFLSFSIQSFASQDDINSEIDLLQAQEFADLYEIEDSKPIQATLSKVEQDFISDFTSIFFAKAYAQDCKVDLEAEEARLASKFQRKEDIKLLATFLIGWGVTHFTKDNKLKWVRKAWLAFSLGKTFMDNRTAFSIEVIALIAPLLWDGVGPGNSPGSNWGWGKLLSRNSVRVGAGATLAVLNGLVAAKSKKNSEEAAKKAAVYQQLMDEMKAKQGSAVLCAS